MEHSLVNQGAVTQKKAPTTTAKRSRWMRPPSTQSTAALRPCSRLPHRCSSWLRLDDVENLRGQRLDCCGLPKNRGFSRTIKSDDSLIVSVSIMVIPSSRCGIKRSCHLAVTSNSTHLACDVRFRSSQRRGRAPTAALRYPILQKSQIPERHQVRNHKIDRNSHLDNRLVLCSRP